MAPFGECVPCLQTVGPPTQFRRSAGGKFVARCQEYLGAKALQECAPSLIASQRRSQRADALRRNDGDQASLSRQGERPLVSSRIGFPHRCERVILVRDE